MRTHVFGAGSAEALASLVQAWLDERPDVTIRSATQTIGNLSGMAGIILTIFYTRPEPKKPVAVTFDEDAHSEEPF